MSHPHLENAPITEAVLEIRTELPPDLGDDVFQRFTDAVAPDYAKKRDRVQFSIGFQGGETKSVPPVVDGVLIEHQELPRIVQARLDGFAVSRLRPYDTWEDLRDSALPLWDTYQEVFRPTRVTRVALRYINAIDVGVNEDPRAHLALLPGIPGPMAPVGLTSFTMQLVTEHPAYGAAAKVIQHLPTVAPDAERVDIILDIDVFSLMDTPPDSEGIWDQFAKLRELKNVLFFSAITPETRERYRHAATTI